MNTHASRRSGIALLLAMIATLALIAASVVLTASPAHAAIVATVDANGIHYQADNADVSAGATVTGCDSPCRTSMDIPASVVIGGTTYAVTTIGDYAFWSIPLSTVVIPDSVTTIASGAFGLSGVTNLTLGNSVTDIEDYAFYDDSLGALTLPDSVTAIGDEAFWAAGVTSLTLGNSITTIGDYAFIGNQLGNLVIPDSVTTIGSEAFNESGLTGLTLGDSVTTIGDGAFTSNSLTTVTIPNSVTSLGASAFSRNSLTSVTLSDALTVINPTAFQYNQLTSVTIPDSVATIGQDAFMSNSLTQVTIPASVTTIEDYAFGLNPLSRVDFDGDAPQITPAGITGSFGPALNPIDLMLYYSGSASGFTTPMWQGYYTTPRSVATTTAIDCPTSVTYTGGALTPCTAVVTGTDGFSQSLAVTYTDNTDAGTATAAATYAGDGTHLTSTSSAAFTITPAPTITTVTCPVSEPFTGSAQTPCTVIVGGAALSTTDPSAVQWTYTDNILAGTATVTATYPGDANHQSSTSTSATFTILPWTMTGFLPPVQPDAVNVVKGGATVPLKFTVTGSTGPITDAATLDAVFTVAQQACDTVTDTTASPLTTTGGTELRYDTTSGQWIQNWKTPATTGGCYRVTLTIADGTQHSALFRTK